MKKLVLIITIFLFLSITNVYAETNIDSINLSFDIPQPGEEIKNINTCTATPSNSVDSCSGVWLKADPNGTFSNYLNGYSEATGVFLEDTTYYLFPTVSLKNSYTMDFENENIFNFNNSNGTKSITLNLPSHSFSFNIYQVKVQKETNRSITISNVDIIDKSEKSESIGDPTFKGAAVNLNARFHNINDYIKYEITILNETNSYIKLNKNDIKLPKSDFVTYDYEIDDKAISPNSSKKVYITMKYTKLKPISEDSCNNYIEDNTTRIAYRDNIVENPQTSRYILLSVLLVVVIISATIITIKSKNKNIQMFMILFTFSIIGIIPLSTSANNNKLIINTYIEVDNNQCVMKINGQCIRTTANIKVKDWYNQYFNNIKSLYPDIEVCPTTISNILEYSKGTVTYFDDSGNTLIQPSNYNIIVNCLGR